MAGLGCKNNQGRGSGKTIEPVNKLLEKISFTQSLHVHVKKNKTIKSNKEN